MGGRSAEAALADRYVGSGHMLELDISHRYGGFELNAEFCVDARGVTTLLGESGSGKTSLINMIAGLVRPDRGRIVFNGQILCDTQRNVHLPPHKRHVGYVFQDARLFPHFSVAGNLTYARRRGVQAAQQVDMDHVVDVLNLRHLLLRRPHALSGGERQRVAIGRALLSGPKLLLMDEPLASLDVARKEEVMPLIERIRDDFGIPIVYVSHAVEEILRLADRLVLMEDGRTSAVGGVEEIFGRIDLQNVTGHYDAGAVLTAQVEAHEDAFDLTRLSFPGGELYVPRLEAAPGAQVRVRILARDVTLSLSPPTDASVLNIFPCKVVEVGPAHGPHVEVRLDAGAPIVARLTRKSVERLDIRPGTQVHAMVKAVSINRQSLGQRMLEEVH